MLIQCVYAQSVSLVPAKLVADTKVEHEDLIMLLLNHCIVFTSRM